MTAAKNQFDMKTSGNNNMLKEKSQPLKKSFDGSANIQPPKPPGKDTNPQPSNPQTTKDQPPKK